MRSHEFIATLHDPKIPDSSRTIKEVFGSLPSRASIRRYQEQLWQRRAAMLQWPWWSRAGPSKCWRLCGQSHFVQQRRVSLPTPGRFKMLQTFQTAQFLAFKLIQAVCSDATSAPGAVSRSTDIYSMTRIDETCPAERGQVVSTPSSPPWQVTNLALDILDLLWANEQSGKLNVVSWCVLAVRVFKLYRYGKYGEKCRNYKQVKQVIPSKHGNLRNNLGRPFFTGTSCLPPGHRAMVLPHPASGAKLRGSPGRFYSWTWQLSKQVPSIRKTWKS